MIFHIGMHTLDDGQPGSDQNNIFWILIRMEMLWLNGPLDIIKST